MDVSQTDDPTLVGEECHMVAKEPEGPRGNSNLTQDQRDLYANLILMCCNHHTMVDDNPGTFPVSRLEAIKVAHEAWVRERLATFDPARQRDDEYYASCVEEWSRRAELDDWEGWASSLVCDGHPSLLKAKFRELANLMRWLFTRAWPGRYRDLEDAFETFRRVLNDLLVTLRKYGHEVGPEEDKTIQVEKRYNRLGRWDPPAYERLAKEFEFAVGLVEDLALELTRAANLICEVVRRTILPTYRLQEGVITITSGPLSDLRYETYRPHYAPGIDPGHAYEGLPQFLSARAERDVTLGIGTGPEDQHEE